jgi:hypothetical protein
MKERSDRKSVRSLGFLWSLIAFFGILLLSGAIQMICAIEFPVNRDYPVARHGEMDFSRYETNTATVYPYVTGEIAYYHDRWAGEENDDSLPTGYINFPGYWYLQGYPKSGYGSLGFAVTHLQKGDRLVLDVDPQNFAYAVYVSNNGGPYRFTFASGTLSKTQWHPAERTVNDSGFIVAIGERMDFLIDFTYSSFGGFLNAPKLITSRSLVEGHESDNIFNGIEAGSLFALFLFVGILFLSAPNKHFALPEFVLASSWILFFFTSYDFLYLFKSVGLVDDPSEAAAEIALYLLGPLLLLAFADYAKKKFGLSFSKKDRLVLGGLLLLSLLSGFLPLPFGAIGWLFLVGFASLLLFLSKAKAPGIDLFFFGGLEGLILGLFLLLYLDFSGLIYAPTLSVDFTFLFPAFLLLIFLSGFSLKREEKRAAITQEEEARFLAARREILQQQLQPHFLFNTLNLIEERYRVGFAEGAAALTQLKRCFAAAEMVNSQELVPLPSEIAAIESYLALMNLRKAYQVELRVYGGTLPIALPPLSLLTFVENSFSHAHFERIAAPKIEIRVDPLETGTRIEIRDNGVGFISEGSGVHTGIANARFRLEHSIQGQVALESDPHEGTRVKIFIPHKEGQK